MNLLFIPTFLLAVVLFVAGYRLASKRCPLLLVAAFSIAAVPAVIMAAYYAKIFSEARWLYCFRALPMTELTASGLGLIAGWLQYQRHCHPRLKRLISPFFIPFLSTLVIAAPYLKQILLRPDWNAYKDRWDENVCLQSSESSCGPASAATLLHYMGVNMTEKEIAQESFTTRRGTENWYLLRTIHRHGVNARYVVTSPGIEHIKFPAIAGVILKNTVGTGHFIAILDEQDGNLVTGDPLVGLKTISRSELPELYEFTGFFLVFPKTPVAK